MSANGIIFSHRRENNPPPFVSNAADNGLSVDPGSGHIVLGNDFGGVSATLLSTREIPCGPFFIILSDPAGSIFFRPGASALISQVDNPNNRNNIIVPGNINITDGNTTQIISFDTTTAETLIALTSDSGTSTGISKFSFQTGQVEQFSIRAGGTTTTINGLTIEKTVALAGIKIFPSGRVFIGVTTPNPVDSGTAQLQIGGSIITAAGGPLTVAPVPIRFGGLVVAAAVLDATQYIEVVHNGILRKLALIV